MDIGMIGVLFIHEGKTYDDGPNRILLMPMGLIAMADYLEQNGIKSRIIHNPIEKKLNPRFDIVTKIADYGAKIVCFDLHWHHQVASVLSLIKRVKSKLPNIIIVAGGYTASFFYKDLISRFPEIDYVIRGDSEIPLLKLTKKILLKGKFKNLNEIPNLVYRQDKEIKINNQSYSLSSQVLKKLNFSNFDLLDNYKIYNRRGIFEGKIDLGRDNHAPGIFFYNCGRGCPYNCSICGGSRESQEIISNRRKIVYAPISSVIRNLKNLAKYTVDTWNNTFDPSKNKEYFIALFKEMRKNKIQLKLQFECLHIPSREFITACERTFKDVILDFIMKTGSDNLRRLNKGNFYSNKEIIDTLIYLKKTKIKVGLCFVAGLPFEKIDDVVKTLLFISFIKNNFKRVDIISAILEMEPASLHYLNSKKYEIINYRKDFNDFLRQHKSKSTLGYRTKNFTMVEIYFIKKYYEVESKCIMEKSYFLKILLENLFALDYFKIPLLHRFCNRCEKYNLCFKDINKVVPKNTPFSKE